jgi:hypothetical protein
MADRVLRDRVLLRFILGDILAAACTLNGMNDIAGATPRTYTAIFGSRALTIGMAVNHNLNDLILIKNGTALVI